MDTPTYAYLALAGAIVAALVVDLVFFGRGRRPSVGSAAAWSIAWTALGVGSRVCSGPGREKRGLRST